MAQADTQDSGKSEENPEAGNNAILLIRIEEMIKTHITQIDQLQEGITKHKEMRHIRSMTK